MTGAEVKRIRESMSGKVTQRAFAELLGISPGGLALIETEQRGVSRALESKIIALVGEDTVKEARSAYGQPIQTHMADFLLDFLADPTDETLTGRAVSLLRQIRR